MMVLGYDFDESGLVSVRKANTSEFPELAAGKKMSLADELEEFLLNEPPDRMATATQAARALGKDRGNVARAFKNDSRFIEVKRSRNEVFYGVRV